MIGLLRAELKKLTTVRSTWILTVIGLALVALQVFAMVLSGAFAAFDGSEVQIADAVGAVGGNSAIVLVVALLAMTTEFRHGTVGRTLQLTPSRTRVLLAKLTAGGVYAVAFVALSLAVVFAVLLIGAASNDVSLSFGGDVVEIAWQGLVASVLTAFLGVAFGALVRAQIVAITVSLVWIFVVESLVTFLRPGLGRWLPFQALSGLFTSESMVAGAPEGMFLPLTPGVALATFTGYVVVFAVAAGLLLRYRDV